MTVFSKDEQQSTTPEMALERLQEGNQRFCKNMHLNRDYLEQAKATAGGQYPFAVVLSCIDSRTSSELIFDQGLGDIFSVRIAGNIVNEDILGSMEFACKVAGVKLIVVLGHSACGAVKGACDAVELGNLTTLLKKIQPAVECETETSQDRCSSNGEFVENVAAINVKNTVDEILKRSSVLKEMIDSGECGIVGGMHDLASGEVNFYQDTLRV